MVATAAAWVGAVAAWAGTALAVETFQEVQVNETAAPLEVAGALAAVLPGPVAQEVLPVWAVASAVVWAAAAGEAVVGDRERNV